jgi:hypothetical protein
LGTWFVQDTGNDLRVQNLLTGISVRLFLREKLEGGRGVRQSGCDVWAGITMVSIVKERRD